MRTLALSVISLPLLLTAAAVDAQSTPPTNDPVPVEPASTTPVLVDDRTADDEPIGALPEALPPPDIHDPGVETPPQEAQAALRAEEAFRDTASAEDRAATPAPADREALPEKVQGPQSDLPDVTIRVDEATGDRIEEYRENGRIWMVRVTPLRGPPYMLLDTNGDGMLDARDGEGPVRPVYWTIYEWN